ncbi:uncharacterized protein LOC103165279 isoform X1 [Ornithorhynchus anatinus]|uniref:uncharacterized protein LOC103165279 isoform X1 n=1 Tax=Ornithorhynchus anatinus TaxID=9258 RepID=UPI0010A7F55F|nr:uncharacterized protein LOC103165279 isoform X1 [Ornithorhynchus anatinus]
MAGKGPLLLACLLAAATAAAASLWAVAWPLSSAGPVRELDSNNLQSAPTQLTQESSSPNDNEVSVTAFNTSACDEVGEQVCLIQALLGKNITFRANVFGSYESQEIHWYKLYSSQGPHFPSYRKRLQLSSGANYRLYLTLNSINEDDFYPNLFWVEVEPSLGNRKVVETEPYRFSDFDIFNPSLRRFFFILESVPIGVSVMLGRDTVTIHLSDYISVPPASFIKWAKEPSDFSFLRPVDYVLTNGLEDIAIRGNMSQDFGHIRALVYNFVPGIPSRVLVAQRLFSIKNETNEKQMGTKAETQCISGFKAEGQQCVDIDECKEGMPKKCLPEAGCTNTNGSYRCHCPQGFEGNGLYSCLDQDECTKGIHNCSQDASCLNTLGSYVCICQRGFSGDGIQCKAKSVWSPWSPWSVCSATCGFQNQIRSRWCTHPESKTRCDGPSADMKLCPNLKPCPINGHWSEWSPWSTCSEACTGTQKRIRLCDNPAPTSGGQTCSGVKEETKECQTENCPVNGMWSPWESWSPCPESCGIGVTRRSRHCTNPAPLHGGEDCVGHGYEEGSCGFPKEFCNFIKSSFGIWFPRAIL